MEMTRLLVAGATMPTTVFAARELPTSTSTSNTLPGPLPRNECMHVSPFAYTRGHAECLKCMDMLAGHARVLAPAVYLGVRSREAGPQTRLGPRTCQVISGEAYR